MFLYSTNVYRLPAQEKPHSQTNISSDVGDTTETYLKEQGLTD